MTLLDTGMRVSELCNLKMTDVQLDDGTLKVMGKGNKERIYPLRQARATVHLALCRPLSP
jgi:site-specific recombinase XerD